MSTVSSSELPACEHRKIIMLALRVVLKVKIWIFSFMDSLVVEQQVLFRVDICSVNWYLMGHAPGGASVLFKAAYSVTMNIFRKFLFSF